MPAPLPAWVKAEPCLRTHLTAMLAAARAMRGRAEVALADLTRTPPPGSREEAASQLRGMSAEADSVVNFGELTWSPDAVGPVHERGGELAAARHRLVL